MNEKDDAPDGEFEAIKNIYLALEPLDDDARSRVVNYIISRLDIAIESGPDDVIETADELDTSIVEEQAKAPQYPSFAELFEAAQPKSNADKALVAGYWLQVCQGQADFDGFNANRELKHLGEGIPNITIAINALKAQKPALVLQIKKSGKSQQARKIYKVTSAGIKMVEAMIKQ